MPRLLGGFPYPLAMKVTLPGKLPNCALIGMVHLAALPSSPGARLDVRKIAAQAALEARQLVDAGFDAVLIENMHDVPYVAGTQDPGVVAAMTVAAIAVRAAVGATPLGIQVLAGGSREAIAIALAADLNFIRAENFVFAHVADEGLMPTAQAAELLRYRRTIGAQRIAIYADIQKKHAAHAITADVPIADHAHAAEFFLADGLIVTGSATGRAPLNADLSSVRKATSLPVLVGSGATAATVASLLEYAQGVIVGSDIKRAGRWQNAVDPARAKKFIKAARAR